MTHTRTASPATLLMRLLLAIVLAVLLGRPLLATSPTPPTTSPASPPPTTQSDDDEAVESPEADEAAWQVVEEHWAIVELNGDQAGVMTQTINSDGRRYRTVTDSTMTVGRGDQQVTVGTQHVFTETHDGRPVSMELQQRFGQQTIRKRWTFEGDTVTLFVTDGSRATRQELNAPDEEWLTPMAIRELWKQRLEAGADTVTYKSINPESNLTVITTTSTFTGEEKTYTLGDREIPLTIWDTRSSIAPKLPVREHYSSDGVAMLSHFSTGMGVMTFRAVTKEQALRQPAGPAPELLVETMVVPDRPIENVMRTTRAVYRVRTRQGEAPDLPVAGAQCVIEADDPQAVTVIVDVNDPQPATEQETAEQAYLGSSAMIDPADPLIEKLAARAVRGIDEQDTLARADALRAAAHRHISRKGLQTAFASASETAKTRAGDCSEHAVLLAAMLRARDIPARIATGLVYVDEFAGQRDVFGWHMWTQALIDGRWIDLDATLPVRFHAGHILSSTASMDEAEAMNDMDTLLMLMGNLEIDVVDVTHGEVTHDEPVSSH